MNVIFIILFVIGVMGSWLLDGKQFKLALPGAKMAYVALNIAFIALFIAMAYDYDIPMLTQWFVHHVSPWVRALVE